MIANVLFDLDGTLTDPFDGITNSVIYALNKLGIVETDRKKLSAFIGPPLWESLSRFYGFDKHKSETAVAYYREYYETDGKFQNTVIDGIPEVLKSLRERGKRLIVATSKPERFAREIIEHFGLSEYFDYVAGASMDLSRSEKADVIKYALDACDISDVTTALMVGDRKHDIIGARANGIKTIGVLFGYGSRDELTDFGAEYIAETPKDILRYID